MLASFNLKVLVNQVVCSNAVTSAETMYIITCSGVCYALVITVEPWGG